MWVKEFVLRTFGSCVGKGICVGTFGSCVGKGICVADVRRDLEETGNYLMNSE